mgnify:FL=1
MSERKKHTPKKYKLEITLELNMEWNNISDAIRRISDNIGYQNNCEVGIKSIKSVSDKSQKSSL